VVIAVRSRPTLHGVSCKHIANTTTCCFLITIHRSCSRVYSSSTAA
jgi:hypothetical protein